MSTEQTGTNTNCIPVATAQTRSVFFQLFLRINLINNIPDRNIIPKPLPMSMKGSFMIDLT